MELAYIFYKKYTKRPKRSPRIAKKLKILKRNNKELKDDKYGGIYYNFLENQLKEVEWKVMQLVEQSNRMKKDLMYRISWINIIQEEMSGQEHKFE